MKAILTLLAAAVTAAALAAPSVAAEKFIPGVTDFPRVEQPERYVPGVTDFPRSGPIEAPARVAVPVTDGFDWLDAGFGAAVGLGLGSLAAAALLTLRRRVGVSPA